MITREEAQAAVSAFCAIGMKYHEQPEQQRLLLDFLQRVRDNAPLYTKDDMTHERQRIAQACADDEGYTVEYAMGVIMQGVDDDTHPPVTQADQARDDHNTDRGAFG